HRRGQAGHGADEQAEQRRAHHDEHVVGVEDEAKRLCPGGTHEASTLSSFAAPRGGAAGLGAARRRAEAAAITTPTLAARPTAAARAAACRTRSGSPVP